MGFYVADNRTLFRENHGDTNDKLHRNKEKMLTNPEFEEYLKYVKLYRLDIYNEITEARSPWRAEWLDADFKTKRKDLYMNYHVFENGKIVQKTGRLDKDTLTEDRVPGINLSDLLTNPTKQGLPKQDFELGNLSYWAPDRDNDSVAGFYANEDGAGFVCYWSSSVMDSGLGVRVAKLK